MRQKTQQDVDRRQDSDAGQPAPATATERYDHAARHLARLKDKQGAAVLDRLRDAVAAFLRGAGRRRTGRHRNIWTRWSPEDVPGFQPTPRHEDEDLGLAVIVARHCRDCRLMQTRDHSLIP